MRVVEIEPSVEKQELARLLGDGRRSPKFSSSVSSKVQTWEKRFERLMEPRLFYRVHSLENDGRGLVRLSQDVSFCSRKLAKSLQDSEKVICFIGSIGSAVDREITRLFRANRLSEAYILDAMGSVAVESMVEQFQQEVEHRYKNEDKSTTLRFSPGYCDWPVTEQKKLFQLFPSKDIDVELSDSCLMKPRKSISGVFGITPRKSSPYNPCLDCRRRDCETRRN